MLVPTQQLLSKKVVAGIKVSFDSTFVHLQ
jgi:hypothetical protein